MENMRLNETPVRTSVNFGINDIAVDDSILSQNIVKYESVIVKNETKNIKVQKDATFEDEPLTFGLGKKIENIEKNSRVKVELEASDIKEQVNINYTLENTSFLNDSIKIEAKENSNGVVVVRYGSNNNTQNIVSSTIKMSLKKNSNAQVIILNMLDLKDTNFLQIETSLEENANLGVIIVDFGAKTSISNYYSSLDGKSSVNTLDTIYIGEKERIIDMNYIAHLKGEKTDVNIEVQGALKDSSKKNFKGTIDFKRGAKRAKGNENEFCMLLSDKARSKALPMLLCTEDDVEGNHSSASGKVNKAELFYLMSRGISQSEALKLLVRAKFTPIIEKIDDEEIKEEILQGIDMKLN